MFKAILVIYDDAIAGLRYRNPKRINSMAVTILNMQTLETIKEHSSIIPLQLPFDEVKYYAVGKSLQMIISKLKPCELMFESNVGEFIGRDESKYKDRVNDLIHRMKLDGFNIKHTSNHSMFDFKASLNLAYTSLVLYYYRKGWNGIPCIECKEGVLVKRHNMHIRYPFMGCSKYPRCNFIVKIPTGSRRTKEIKF